MVPADAGEYTVVVSAGGKTFTKEVQIIEDVWFDRMYLSRGSGGVRLDREWGQTPLAVESDPTGLPAGSFSRLV